MFRPIVAIQQANTIKIGKIRRSPKVVVRNDRRRHRSFFCVRCYLRLRGGLKNGKLTTVASVVCRLCSTVISIANSVPGSADDA